MEILISIAGKVAEYAVEPIQRQFGYLIFYRINVQNLKIKVKNLEEARQRVQHDIDDATCNALEIETDVKSWLNRVDEIVEEAYSFYEEEDYQKCSKFPCSNLLRRHKISRKAKKMTDVILQIQAQSNFERVAYDATPKGMRTAQHQKDYKVLKSRTNTINEILEALKDTSIHTIGVYGLGGVGKTTLAKEVGRIAKEQKLFDVIVMTTVTEKPNMERTQGEIADSLRLRFDGNTVVGKANRLRERIKKEKTILVIVDDIWAEFDLEEFGIPLGDEHKGCKLLLTSRNLGVLRRDMGIQRGFQLEVLQEDEAWSLFEKVAGNVVNDANLQPTAAEVVKRCAGLPVLIVTIAKALRNKEICAWKDALKQLQRFDKDGMHKKIYSALEVSFNHLETEELKSFFLLIGLRGTHRVYKFCLLMFCMWSGLIKNLDSVEDARNRVQTLTSDLMASSLLLEAETGWVAMHDVVREVCMSLASKHLKFLNFAALKEWPFTDTLKECREIFLPTEKFRSLPDRLECPELQLLVLENLNGYMQVSDSFFEETRDVKVLDLVGLRCTPKLPTSIGLLKNLKALSFYYCMLEDIALVGELTNLEFLGLDGSNIKILPREVGKLHRLRFLDLKHCPHLQVIPPKVLSNLTRLEELYMGASFCNWEAEGETKENTNASLNELIDLHHLTTIDLLVPNDSVWPVDLMFKQLQRFGIFIGDVWQKSYYSDSGEEEVWYAKGEYEFKTLKLKLNRSIESVNGVKLLMEHVDYLFLDELKGVKNVLYDLNCDDGFSMLKHLTVQNNGEVKCIAMSSNHPLCAFANLESLVLSNLCSLEHICHGPLARESFRKLNVIKVQQCGRLQNIFSNSMIKDLSHLKAIEVSECKLIEAIVSLGGENLVMEFSELQSLTMQRLPALISFCSIEAKEIDKGDNPLTCTIPLFNQKVSFPKLEKLMITEVGSLMIWSHYQLHQNSFCKLKTVEIKDCEKLGTIFPGSIVRNLHNLETLTVSNCSSVEEVFEIEELNDINPHAGMSIQLKSLRFVQLPKLKLIWNDTDLQGIFNFQNLEKVCVKDCPILKYIFPVSVAKHLGELKELMIETSPTTVLYG